MQQQKGLAIASLVLGIIGLLTSCCGGGLLGLIGLVLGIVALTNKQSKGLCIGGIIVSSIAIVITVFAFALGFISGFMDDESDKETTTEATTEITTEVTTIEETEMITEETEATTEMITEEDTESTTEETTEIDIDELKANAQEVTYEDIYRNPETWSDKYIKIVVKVDKYESKFFGLYDTYYCNVNGQTLFVTEHRSVAEPTIASGDTVLIYGKGSGLATLTESQINILGIKTSKEESKVPSIDMYAAELQ